MSKRRIVKEKGIWPDVSTLNIRRLAKDIEEEKFNEGIMISLLKFGVKEKTTNITLVKKKEEE